MDLRTPRIVTLFVTTQDSHMPRQYSMTWESPKSRWRKLYRDKLYVISCKQLGVPASKEASYQAANRWWAAKRAEIDGNLPPHPNAQYLNILGQRLAWAQAHGRRDLTQSLDDTIEKVRSDATGQLNGRIDPFDLPAVVLDLMDHATWKERLSEENIDPIPQDQTIGAQVEVWLETQRLRVKTRKLSADRYDNVKDGIERFRAFLGSSLPVTSIDEDRLERYYFDLQAAVGKQTAKLRAGLSPSTAESYFKVAKQLIKFLYTRRLIELPRNLNDRQLRFDVQARSVLTFSVEEVRKLVADATGQVKLHILLALNCGYTNTDIAELRDSQIDWQRGAISRKRSKTQQVVNVPTVTYQLWPQTIELLRHHRSGKDTVLLTRSGGPWAFRTLDDQGKLHKNDNIAPNFRRLQRRINVGLAFKYLRKTSATMLESHELYGRYKGHFLGHAPRGLAEKHYAAPSPDLFDKIIGWLGDQYGPSVSGG